MDITTWGQFIGPDGIYLSIGCILIQVLLIGVVFNWLKSVSASKLGLFLLAFIFSEVVMYVFGWLIFVSTNYGAFPKTSIGQTIFSYTSRTYEKYIKPYVKVTPSTPIKNSDSNNSSGKTGKGTGDGGLSDTKSQQCQEITAKINKILDDANYCTQDADCVDSKAVLGCPFGCRVLINRGETLPNMMPYLEEYSKKCPLCVYECGIESGIKCINKKCEDVSAMTK